MARLAQGAQRIGEAVADRMSDPGKRRVLLAISIDDDFQRVVCLGNAKDCSTISASSSAASVPFFWSAKRVLRLSMNAATPPPGTIELNRHPSLPA
jgi:hypothetical protein